MFAAGLVTSGVVAGAGPLAVLSDSTMTETTTDAGTTSTEPTTESTTTEDETTAEEATESTTTESETTTTEPETTTTESTPAPSGPPTIASDKADYSPGELVRLTGSSWQPGETVNIDVNDDEGQSWRRNVDVVANSSGEIGDQFNLPDWFVATYRVVATGSTSGTATTTFTDSNVTLSPNATTVSATAGSTVDASVTVTRLASGPAGNPVVTSLATPGGNPNLCFGNSGAALPAAWLSVTSPALPHTMTGPTGSTQVFTVRVAPPPGTAADNYRTRISFNVTNGNANDVQLCLTVAADGTPPAGSVAINSGAGSTNSTSATLNLQATDAVGVTAYRVANGSSCSSATYVPVTPTTSFSTTIAHTLLSGDGTKTVCAQYRDAAGNESTTYTDTIVLDTVKPTITGAATSPPGGSAYSAGDWTNDDVEVTFTCADNAGGSGLASNTVAGQTITAEGVTSSVSNIGTCTDNAGNTADSASFGPIRIDKTKPTITVTATSPPGGAAYSAGTWTNANVQVAFTCTDNAGGSGLASNTVAGTTVTAEGTTTSVTNSGGCADEAGNSADSASFGPVLIDKTKPTLTATATSPPDGADYVAGDWTRFNVKVAFACEDALSGIGLGGDAVPDVTVTDEGTTASVSSTGTCTDRAGNVADDASFGPIRIDKTAPTLTASATSPAGGAAYTAGTWTRFSVEVAFDCADALSGVAADTVPDETLTVEGSNQSVTSSGNCTDNAGNEADPATFANIDIDKSDPNAPTASADRAPEYAGGGGWYKDTVTVSFAHNGDPDLVDGSPGSGVDPASVPAPTPYNTSGTHTKSGTVKDNAGNESAPASLTVQVDATNPVFGACTGGPFLLGSGSQPVSITASDAHSGLDAGASTLSGSVDTSSVGSKTVTYTALDNVGHTETKTCTYSVIFDFHGFFQPVDNNGVYNTVNSGQAIPVKFDLSGNQGLNIFAAGYPASTKVACTTGSGSDPVEETLTAGNSSLTYSEGQPFGRYHYVWKTDKAWANTCRRLDLKLIDGTTHSALFKFTK